MHIAIISLCLMVPTATASLFYQLCHRCKSATSPAITNA
jgi:hypothetical protein